MLSRTYAALSLSTSGPGRLLFRRLIPDPEERIAETQDHPISGRRFQSKMPLGRILFVRLITSFLLITSRAVKRRSGKVIEIRRRIESYFLLEFIYPSAGMTFGRRKRKGQAVPRWGKNFLTWRIR